jgi:hypothetical protein
MRDRLLPPLLLVAFLPWACDPRSAPAPAAPSPSSPAPTPAASAPAVVSPAPQLARTNLTRADRAAWRRVLGWPADCEEAFTASAAADAPGIEIDPLSPGRSLVEVRCAWGAYQGSQVYYFYDETRKPAGALPLTFEVRESPDDRSLVRSETREVSGLPTFDARTGQLSILDKFRGPGDCGTLATYAFVEGTVRLTELRAKVACDGQGAEEPEKWPEIPLAPVASRGKERAG